MTGNNGHEKEMEILGLIPGESSWEQIIYQVVAMNELDPWNLDITKLSTGFSEHISSLDELDFRVPAKWVIIAAVLLRMKSDYIKIMKMDRDPEPEGFIDMEELDDEEIESIGNEIDENDVDPIAVSSKRKPIRRITLNELVDSLRRVLATEKRRDLKLKKARGKIKIRTDDIGLRIEKLYGRITMMINSLSRENSVKFSDLVEKWEKENVIDTFMPLIHLDNDNKVECTQKEMFDEIYIKRKDAPQIKNPGSNN